MRALIFCCKKFFLSGPFDDLSFSGAQIRERKIVYSYECTFSLCHGLSYLCVSQPSLASLPEGLRCLSFVSHLNLAYSQFNRAQESVLGNDHLGPNFGTHCWHVAWSERFPPEYSSHCSLLAGVCWPPGLGMEAHVFMVNCHSCTFPSLFLRI